MNLRILLFLVFIPTVVLAELQSLKILDQAGLVRGMKQVEGLTTVTVEGLSSDLQITLQSLDKIEPEKEGERVGNKVTFRGVSPGIWRITGSQEGISKVTIATQ
jgi:hypothetical protein